MHPASAGFLLTEDGALMEGAHLAFPPCLPGPCVGTQGFTVACGRALTLARVSADQL